jgi:hypothetical protein
VVEQAGAARRADTIIFLTTIPRVISSVSACYFV